MSKKKNLLDDKDWEEYIENLSDDEDDIPELNPERDFNFYNNDDYSEDLWDSYE